MQNGAAILGNNLAIYYEIIQTLPHDVAIALLGFTQRIENMSTRKPTCECLEELYL